MNIFTLLGIVFVVLKLTNVIAWSWWLVVLPFLPLAFTFLILILGLLVTLLGVIVLMISEFRK